MIPVSLSLKNFLSYGDTVPPLDFSEFDVACLSGRNGHGKSAILDAMTWALWGEARKAVGEKTPSDGLVRIGAPEMQVEFVFDLEQDRYRILRKYRRKKGKRGTHTLDFQIFDDASRQYKVLTEGSLRKTQEKINATLRMTYDTFINSAFIVQGHVDEFTKRNPSQRKAVLADILDLSRYDALRELARGHLRETEREQDGLARQLAAIQEELRHKAAYEQELAHIGRTLHEITEGLQTAEVEQHTLMAQRTELLARQQQLTDKQQHDARLRQEIGLLKERIQRQERQMADNARILDREAEILSDYERYQRLYAQSAEYDAQRQAYDALHRQCAPLENAIRDARHVLETERERRRTERAQTQRVLDDTGTALDRAGDVERGYRELRDARQQDEAWEELRLQHEEITQSLRTVEQEIAAAKNRLDVDLNTLRRQISEAQAQADQQPQHKRRLTELKQEVARFATAEQEFEQNKEDGAQCRAALDSLKANRERNVQAEADLQERIELLKRSQQPQCPLCQSALDDQKKHDIEAHFQAELDTLSAERRAIDAQRAAQEARIADLRKTYKRLEKMLKKAPTARQQVSQTEHALQAAQQAAEQAQRLTAEADALTATIAQRQYAADAHQRFDELQQRQAALSYDAKAHQHLRKRLKTLQHFDGEYSKLEDIRARHEQAAASLPGIDAALTDVETRLQQQEYADSEQRALQDLHAQIQALGYDADAHERIRQAARRLEKAPTQKAELDQARKAAQDLERAHAELLEERQHKSEQLAELQRVQTELADQLTQLGPFEERLRLHQEDVKRLRSDRDTLLQRQAAMQAKFDHCLELAAQQNIEQERKTRIDKESRVYDQLYKMFGKDGIQAYLIEHAIPEIEDEANAILSRLTGNTTSIAIESVKDAKSGGTRETLDIKISDELGTRSYELYSGGEAFRVDFSIRVALSKLLATRAGTRLRTLVIDEGFGTQDARGLEQLVQAITEISQDFEKILVITHIEALKDAFPVRIEVVKHPDIGSQYQIVH